MTTTTWTLDTAHTDVLFSAKHMMVTSVRGTFHAVDGSLTADEAHPERARGTFTVQAASLSTGVERRDEHLRSADFLDAATYPEIIFVITNVAAKGGRRYAVTGDLAIRGTTRPITFDTELLGLYRSMKGARRAGFHATARLDREDWGLTWNVALESGGWLVGKEIQVEIDLAVEEASQAKADTAAA